IHRDIKPDNILLGTDGGVKVADFGLARRTDPAGMELTQAGMTWGTPLYMSPEQIHGQSLDGRSDIYSLGVTAYHTLAGRPPFEGDTPMAVALQHVNQTAEPLLRVRPQVPAEISQLIERMMAKDPADRPASGGEVLELLEAYRGGTGGSAAGATVPIRGSAATQLLDRALAAESKPKPPAWRRLGTMVAFMVGVMLAVLVFGRDPLRPTRAEALAVPQQETAQKQFFYAELAKSEASWKAVLEYFPPVDAQGQTNEVNRLYNLRAKRELVRWYIGESRPRDARPLIDELAALGGTDRQFQLFGRAWQVILATATGESERASEILAGIWDDRGELDRATRTQLQRARRQLLSR
ncbi:MAG: serine/threonine-protein kinase, partial [Planctomycetota bacterium]